MSLFNIISQEYGYVGITLIYKFLVKIEDSICSITIVDKINCYVMVQNKVAVNQKLLVDCIEFITEDPKAPLNKNNLNIFMLPIFCFKNMIYIIISTCNVLGSNLR